MTDENESHVATEEETIAALRRFGWLRNDGDGERLHSHREPWAQHEEERCTGYYKAVCALKKGHRCPHLDETRPTPLPAKP